MGYKVGAVSEETEKPGKIEELEQENERLRTCLEILLNGLSCVGRTAYLEGAEDIEEATCRIAQLVQYNLMQKNKLHPIKKELANIEQYFYIQKMRMGKYLTWEISVDERAAACRIPNLSLYPLVESEVRKVCANAEGGKLCIFSKWEADGLRLVVEGGGSTAQVAIPREETKE